jgi:hypothetical protein
VVLQACNGRKNHDARSRWRPPGGIQMPGDGVESAGARLAMRPKPTDADADLRCCAGAAQRQDGDAGLQVVGRPGIEKAAAAGMESLLADQHMQIRQRGQHRHAGPAGVQVVVAAPRAADFVIGTDRVPGRQRLAAGERAGAAIPGQRQRARWRGQGMASGLAVRRVGPGVYRPAAKGQGQSRGARRAWGALSARKALPEFVLCRGQAPGRSRPTPRAVLWAGQSFRCGCGPLLRHVRDESFDTSASSLWSSPWTRGAGTSRPPKARNVARSGHLDMRASRRAQRAEDRHTAVDVSDAQRPHLFKNRLQPLAVLPEVS